MKKYRYYQSNDRHSFFIKSSNRNPSRKLKGRISAMVRKIPRNTYYIDSNGCLVSEK